VLHRAWEKWSYAANLKVTAREIEMIANQLRTSNLLGAEEQKVLDTFKKVGADVGGNMGSSLPMRSVSQFAGLSVDALTQFGEALIAVRQADTDQMTAVHDQLLTTFQGVHPAQGQSVPLPAPQPPKGFSLVADALLPGLPGAKLYSQERVEPLGGATAGGSKAMRGAQAAAAPGTSGERTTTSTILILPESGKRVGSFTATPMATTLDPMIAWALKQDVQQAPGKELLDYVQRMGFESAATIAQVQSASQAFLKGTTDAVYGFGQRMNIEPVGYLHLERLSFIPAGIERGELVYSVPLSPAEEVNISHKEWSNTSEEFQTIVTDYIENYSEEGVSEKSELTQSTSSQDQHSMGFNTGVTASGGFGPVTITASASLSLNQSSSHSEQSARNHSNTLTRKASARSKKEHKTSFKVASASGTEDQAIRLIKNPFTDKATRVDYYQLVRKWRVDLYRYGVRLTYDLTVPEPGSDILSKILEIQALQAALSQGFNSPDSTLPWARFDLTPDQITRDNYTAYAASYGVVADPPPPDQLSLVKSFNHQWTDMDQAQNSEYTSFEIDLPEGYVTWGLGVGVERWHWDPADWHFHVLTNFNTWFGASGPLTLTVGTRYVQAFDIELSFVVGLTDIAYNSWVNKTWGGFRDAALARFEETRAMLSTELERLQNALGAQDALSLRKLEREEVMKNVLRWMFGPTFSFVPPGLPPDLYAAGGSIMNAAVWNKELAQGEIVKFLHHAIEWENVLYFLYPYFWSHVSRWEFKKYLDHPDFMHRTFLKAGSARVVLTIRPGFEKDFVSYMETGTFDGLPSTHPYMTIAEEVEAFANTNYPGVRPANPVNDARPLLSPRQKKAWADMQVIMGLLEDYKAAQGDYPTTAAGLAALSGTYALKDPWNNLWSYASPGVSTDYELASLGSGGVEGGEDEAADINSWAEASLIGRWYEYTPTPALDIAFAEILPTA
jgi:hypothetical protein